MYVLGLPRVCDCQALENKWIVAYFPDKRVFFAVKHPRAMP
jgi:hypothetical protein